jgi:endonuclease/exonuclease/phosphatase family metal-dependent hydrolase
MKLKLITWNIDSDYRNINLRCEKLLTVISTLDPDIICLQEVRKESFEFFSFIFPQFTNFGFDKDQMFCNVVFVRSSLFPVFEKISLVGTMNRNIILIFIDSFIISTTHLESGRFNSDVRKLQTDYITTNLLKSPALVCGDFNFSNFETLGNYLQVSPFKPTCAQYYLDRIFVNSPMFVVNNTRIIGTYDMSDHLGIFLDFST